MKHGLGLGKDDPGAAAVRGGVKEALNKTLGPLPGAAAGTLLDKVDPVPPRQ